GMPGYNPNLVQYAYDLPRARELLADAGHPGGKGLPPLELWTSATTTTALQEHEAIKQDLASLGLKVELITAANWKQYKTYVQGIELNALGERYIPMKKIWLDATHRGPRIAQKP